MKALLIDKDTLPIVSTVLTQTEILNKEVFLVEPLEEAIANEDEPASSSMRHMKACIFVRPANQNFLALAKVLRQPIYSEYHLFFSNVVPHSRLSQLAACDEYECVASVTEVYADVIALNPALFALNSQSVAQLHREQTMWTAFEESVFQRQVDGIFSATISLGCLKRGRGPVTAASSSGLTLPVVRYSSASPLARKVALALQKRLEQDESLFESVGGSAATPVNSGGGMLVLVADRRDDPVTPLLTQWTYQAMVHELLGLENNRVMHPLAVAGETAAGSSKDGGVEVVLSTATDKFFRDNYLSNFGDLGVHIKEYVEMYQQQTKNQAKVDNVEDMQRFLDQYPEYRKLSSNVSKHVALVHEISRMVEKYNLMECSELEQSLACDDHISMHEQLKRVKAMIENPRNSNLERLKVSILYALRFETDTSGIRELKGLLQQKGVGLISTMLDHFGSASRLPYPSSSGAAAALARRLGFTSATDNVYTQHRSPISITAEQAIKGKVKEQDYVTVVGSKGRINGVENIKPSLVLVFMVGGCTFEEARDVDVLNEQFVAASTNGPSTDARGTGSRPPAIVLGGSTVHNSKTFLADVAQLSRLHGPTSSGIFGGLSSPVVVLMAPHKKQQQQQQAGNAATAATSEMVNARTKNKALKEQLSNLNRMTKSDAKQLASLTKEVEDLRNAVKELMKLSKRPGQKPTKMELDKVIPESVRAEVIDAAYAPTRSPSEERGRQQPAANGNKNGHKAAPSTGVRSTQPQQRQGNNKRYNSSKVVAENQLKNMLGMPPAPPRQRTQPQGKRNAEKQAKQGAPDNELAQSIREKLRRANTKEEVRAATNMARAVGMTYEAGLGDKKLSTMA
ncbi:vacuolar protein sorting-associated protein 45 [Perkinsus chesapeaki]|uniref:Vacuolar protein sorting-associated protein 45 n=1 Tax=Perkinsus chesapeaki TaxID=330153 RepID=A0A7J6LIH0_PERCH|nr:vacuolar protein sorting-associated protein 45 [Perkinsus chesapeaki]